MFRPSLELTSWTLGIVRSFPSDVPVNMGVVTERAPTEVIATRVPTEVAGRWKVLAAKEALPISQWLRRAAVLAEAYSTLDALGGLDRPTDERLRRAENAACAVAQVA